jgi:glutathione synthase/RimK-type ligase-like ATP-grasp enzyme
MPLLIAGGDEDTSLSVLANAAEKSGVPIVDLRLSACESPAFCWDLGQGWARISGKDICSTAAFVRYDAFTALRDPRPAVSARAGGWYQTVTGWLLSESTIRMFNRHMSQAATNKPAALLAARQAGLRIPSTLITNEIGRFPGTRIESMVAKPVAGGDYCYSLREALEKAEVRNGLTAVPAIVQQRLVAPEKRIYVIGASSFAFEVRSDSLDYRVKQDAELILLPEMPPELESLRRLMSLLGLDFGAADFKTDPETGQLVFLELNTSPMFARFDEVSRGQLCAAMVKELVGEREARSRRASAAVGPALLP